MDDKPKEVELKIVKESNTKHLIFRDGKYVRMAKDEPQLLIDVVKEIKEQLNDEPNIP